MEFLEISFAKVARTILPSLSSWVYQSNLRDVEIPIDYRSSRLEPRGVPLLLDWPPVHGLPSFLLIASAILTLLYLQAYESIAFPPSSVSVSSQYLQQVAKDLERAVKLGIIFAETHTTRIDILSWPT